MTFLLMVLLLITLCTITCNLWLQDRKLSMQLMFFIWVGSIGALGSFTTEIQINALGPWEVLLINRN